MSRLSVFLVAVFCIIGAAAAQSGGAIEVKNAWARATPGGAENGAAYLTLEAPAGDRLTAVSTPVAKKAELHIMSMDGGIMKMRPLDGIDLAPGQETSLKPGGAHIMLMGLNRPLQAGQTFPLTLQFEKSGAREVQVHVEKFGAMAPSQAAGTMPVGGGAPPVSGH